MVATFSEPQSWTEDDELKLQLVEAELSAREAKRERSIAARDNFAAFVQASWDIVEPARPFIPNWHMDAIAEHLQAVFDGKIRRLLINVPPGHAKSLLVSVLFPAWVWTKRPQHRFLCSSYSEDLSLRDAVRCRTLVEHPWYKTTFTPDWRLKGDQNLKRYYENTRSGFRFSHSVGGKGTGFRGDCVAGESVVPTSAGLIPMRTIVEGRLAVKVLGSLGFSEVNDYMTSPGRTMVELVDDDGRTLRCTDDHPVFVDTLGYMKAVDLIDLAAHGQVFLRGLRSDFQSRAQACGAGGTSVLLGGVPGDLEQWSGQPSLGRWADVEGLSALREFIRSGTGRSGAANLLLQGLRQRGARGRGEAAGASLRGMWTALRAVFESPAVLLDHLCQRASSHGGAWGAQRTIHPWGFGDAVFAGLHGQDQDFNSAARWTLLRGVLGDAPDYSGAPHRRLENESRVNQPGQPVHPMSPQGSYQAGHQSSLDGAVRLASVRRCAAPDLVYNLRVAGNNDYYANGILTHNCQIIDDPLNAKDQFSDAKLEECKFWLDNVMSSRFNDSAKGARVIIMQRLSERDLSGHVIAQGGYEHLCLPSEFEPERRCVTSTGWTDPRTEYGELMFEQLFPREVIEKAKVELATYGFAGQHQQRPAPLTGGIWKNYWWRYWKPANVDLPPVSVRTEDGTVMEIIAQDLPDAFDEEMLSFDCSFKDLNESDYVAGGHWGRKGVFKYLLLDSIHARLSFTATVEAFKQMCARNPKASTKLVEDKANGTAVIDTLKGKISGIIPVNPEGGKVARANGVAPDIESGCVYLPHPALAPWVDQMIHECSTFPNAPNDDWVDMISQALKRWQDQVYGLLDLMKEYTVDAKMRGVRIASVSLAEGKTPTPKEEDVNKVATSAVIKPATAPNTQCCPKCQGVAIISVGGSWMHCNNCSHDWSKVEQAKREPWNRGNLQK